MNREEAIKKLKEVEGNNLVDTGEELEAYDELLSVALDMAIEALHREEAEEKGYCHRIRPSNVEVVVRCKDCKHRSEGGWCDVYIQPRMETDFCNHGERQCNYFGERKEP